MATIMRLARPGAVSVQTLVCNVGKKAGRSQIKTVVMLDSGSNTTCVDEDVAEQLKLRHRSEPTKKTIHTIDGRIEINTRSVDVILSSIDGLITRHLIAQTVKNLTRNTSVVDWSECKKNFEHLQDVPFDTLPANPIISLLIGADQADLFSPIEGTKHEGARGEPIAYQTALGWTCLGPSVKPKPEEVSEIYLTINSMMPSSK
jgi:hypothetical protein